MKRETNRGVWVIALLVALAYPFLFPHPLGRGLYLKPVWNLDLAEKGEAAGPSADGQVWFRAGNRFGYVRLDGRPGYLGRVLWGVCLSDAGFINYGRISESIVFADPAGQFVYGLQIAGYPLLDRSGKNLFVVNTDLSGIRRVEPGGESLWSLEFASPITTAALAADGVLLGLMNGRLLLVNGQGRLDLELAPAGSRIPIALGSAVSPGGDRVAAIVGIGPQRLNVLERREGRWAPVWTRSLDGDQRREMMLRFTEDGRFLLYERQGGVGVLDLAQKREVFLPHAGRLTGLTGGGQPPDAPGEPGEDAGVADARGTAAFLTRLPDASSASGLTLVGLPGSVLVSERIAAPAGSLRQVGGRLLLGMEGHLLRLDIQEE